MNRAGFDRRALAILGHKLRTLLRMLSYPEPVAMTITADILRLLAGGGKQQALCTLAAYLEREGVRARWNGALERERAPVLAELIVPHLKGSVLDLLSGNGLLALALSSRIGRPVATVERRGCDGAPLRPAADHDFSLFAAAAPAKAYDSVLLCTVLHHERNPGATLDLAARVARKRVVVVENCVERECPDEYQQLVDLIFNESLNKTSLPCPSNHRTLQGWLEAAAAYGEARHVASIPAAPGVPLSHDMFVIEVRA